MKKVFILGKIYQEPVAQCTMKFGSAQKHLEAQGIEAINPLAVSFNENFDKAIKKWIVAMLDCDAVLLLPDWMDDHQSSILQKLAQDVNIRSLIGSSELKKKLGNVQK